MHHVLELNRSIPINDWLVQKSVVGKVAPRERTWNATINRDQNIFLHGFHDPRFLFNSFSYCFSFFLSDLLLSLTISVLLFSVPTLFLFIF